MPAAQHAHDIAKFVASDAVFVTCTEIGKLGLVIDVLAVKLGSKIVLNVTHAPSGEHTSYKIGAAPSHPNLIRNKLRNVKLIASGMPFLVNFEVAEPSSGSPFHPAREVNVCTPAVILAVPNVVPL